jgi:hypothetical protein
MAALGWPKTATHNTAADLDVRTGALQLQVAPLQGDGLADPQARRGQEPEERPRALRASESSVVNSWRLIALTSSSSVSSAVGRCGKSTSRAGLERIRPSRGGRQARAERPHHVADRLVR